MRAKHLFILTPYDKQNGVSFSCSVPFSVKADRGHLDRWKAAVFDRVMGFV